MLLVFKAHDVEGVLSTSNEILTLTQASVNSLATPPALVVSFQLAFRKLGLVVCYHLHFIRTG